MNTASETSSVMMTSLAAPAYAAPAALLYVLLGLSLASRKRACGARGRARQPARARHSAGRRAGRGTRGARALRRARGPERGRQAPDAAIPLVYRPGRARLRAVLVAVHQARHGEALVQDLRRVRLGALRGGTG